MRAAILALAVGFVGCAKPPPAEVPAAAVAPAAPEVAPAPRRVSDDPRRPARMEWLRSSKDPILRDMARGHITAGDAIEPLVRRNPHYDVFRFGGYVVMEDIRSDPTTRLVGKGGTVRYGSTSSCIFQEEFIQSLSEEERTECWTGYSTARQRRLDAWAAIPAVVGLPAAQLYWLRPRLPE